MLTLAPGARLVVAADTGRGNIVTPAGDLWTLNAAAVTVLRAVEGGGCADDATVLLLARFPGQAPADVRRNVDAVLDTLLKHGAVVDR